jgi:hypothetical protein
MNARLRLLLLACATSLIAPLAAHAAISPAVNHTAARIAPANSPMLATFPLEVRLRKLHLVRPDLIPYPIEMEVVC